MSTNKRNNLLGTAFTCYTVPAPRVIVYDSYKQMCKDLAHRGVKTKPQKLKNYSACTYDFVVDGKYTLVVLTNFKKCDKLHYKVECLCHEAVHCAQRHFDYFGEESPASEEYAYVVQGIVETLLYVSGLFKW